MTAQSAPATDATAPGRIVVTGNGASAATPDAVEITLTAQCVGPDLAGALGDVVAAMDTLSGVLDQNGVPAASRQTTGFWLEPHWDSAKGAQDGFEGRQGVRIRLDRVDRLGPVVGAAVAAVGNALQVGQIELVVTDPAAASAQARSAALDDAKAKAEELAGQCGRELGAVLQIVEQAPGQAVAPRVFAAERAMAKVDAGSSDLTASLTVDFELR